MTNENFLLGFLILHKYVGAGHYDICAEHDQIWYGPDFQDICPEDCAKLKGYGWLLDKGVGRFYAHI